MTNPKTNLKFVLTALLIACAMPVCAQTQDSDKSIVDSQQRLAEKYDRLELLAGRLAELSRSTQPRRARLLREFVSKSRERDLTGRFGNIVKALQQEKLATAVKDQDVLQGELQQLLELLLQEDRDTQIEAERKRIGRYLSQLKKLIRKQSGIKSRTEGRDDQQELTDDQTGAAREANSLSEEIRSTEGSPEDSSDGSDSSQSQDSTESNSKDSRSKSGESDSKDSDQAQSEESQPGQEDSQDSKDSNSSEKQTGESGAESKSSKNSAQSEQSQSKQSESKQGDSQSSESQPSDSQSGQSQSGQSQSGKSSQQDAPQKPADRATQRLQQAQQRMQQAIEKLKESKHDDAIEDQEAALRELEQAKAELEKILRQLREEELERMLVLLEARFRKMLDAQVVVYEQTKENHQRREQVEPHELVIASARLSRKEKQIIREADRALVLLREDGTSVAFPEALEQAKQDMESVAERLNEVKIAAITQALEEDIIAALEETLAAFQQALKDLRDQKSQSQQGSGQPPEQSLVDKLAELRMIRALQNRINRRTVLYGNMIEGEQALEAELLEALDELAQREERVYRATLDLHQGAND